MHLLLFLPPPLSFCLMCSHDLTPFTLSPIRQSQCCVQVSEVLTFAYLLSPGKQVSLHVCLDALL